MWKRCCAASALALLLAPAAAQAYDVLVFTKTQGYRHESIPDGVAALRELGATGGFTVTDTQDAGAFTPEGLARYRAVVFLSTNEDALDDAQQAALEQYVRGGGGWVGIHAAAAAEYGWPFYGAELLGGAWFRTHPPIQPAAVEVEDFRHPSTRGLPARWTRNDEWFAFTASPRTTSRVLLRVDESSYDPHQSAAELAPADASMGPDHPIAWCRNVGRGRSWFTALGHTPASYREPELRKLLLGGIQTAAGALPANCTPRPRPVPRTHHRASAARRYAASRRSYRRR